MTGPVVVAPDVGASEEVFAEGKSGFVFQTKTLRVRRLLDRPHRAAVYVAYSTRLGSSPEGARARARLPAAAPPLACTPERRVADRDRPHARAPQDSSGGASRYRSSTCVVPLGDALDAGAAGAR